MVKVSSKPITAVALSQDGAVLALGCADLTIFIVDASSLRTLDRIKDAHSFSITCIAISPDKRVVASGSADNTCRIITLPLQFSQTLPINPLHTLMLALLVAGILLWLTTLIDIESYFNRDNLVQERLA
ncbi:hypothetical protein RMCBS344292_15713 [Rhizopus microsporus]|nr:hypothetical protein RMCBS344292_15713 [Rhizopus microsporus]